MHSLEIFALATTVLVVFVPGLILGFTIGLRNLWLWAIAPAITFTLLTIVSTALPFFGLAWNLGTAAAGMLALGLVIFLLFKFVIRQKPFLEENAAKSSSTLRITALLTVVFATLITGIYAAKGIGSLNNISQTYDNIFHLNLIEYTLDRATASPIEVIKMVTSDATTSFYPNAWHTLVSITMMLTGVEITAAVHITNLAILSIFPLGMLLMTRQIFGESRFVIIATGILAVSFPALPLNLMSYGVLYPFLLGMLLVPQAVAIILYTLKIGAIQRTNKSVAEATILLGVIPGIVVSHPGALMAVLALSVPAVITAALYGIKTASAKAKFWRLITLAVFITLGFLMLLRVRPSLGSVRGPKFSFLTGLKQTLLLDFTNIGFPIVLSLLMIAGVILALKTKSKTSVTIVLTWVVGALLFYITASVPFWKFRALTTGVWYSDHPRLAAVYVIALIPAIIFAVQYLRARFVTHSQPAQRNGQKYGQKRSAFILLALFVGAQLGAGYFTFIPKMQKNYAYAEDSNLVSIDEAELLKKLPDLVPEGSKIVGNPWTGTGMAYALAKREVLLPHVSSYLNESEQAALTGINDISNYPELCADLQSENIRFVLDFGDLEVHGDHHSYPGIENPEESAALTLVAEVGEAKLFEVTACNFL